MSYATSKDSLNTISGSNILPNRKYIGGRYYESSSYRGNQLLATSPSNPSLSDTYSDCSWADSYHSIWRFHKPKCKYVQAPLSMPPTSGDPDTWRHSNISFWPIIIIVIMVYLIWTEYGSQDCRNQDCNNRAKIVYDFDESRGATSGVETCDSTHNDSNGDIIDKISTNIMKNHTVIGWRRSLIASIVIAILILIIFCQEFPHGFTVVMTVLLVFMIVYFSSAWFQAHWWKFNDYKIDDSLQKFRNRL